MDEKELHYIASCVCDAISEKMDCEDCPFDDRCSPGHNGAWDFVKEKAEE